MIKNGIFLGGGGGEGKQNTPFIKNREEKNENNCENCSSNIKFETFI